MHAAVNTAIFPTMYNSLLELVIIILFVVQ